MTEKKISEIIPSVMKNLWGQEEFRTQGIIDWDKIWAEICGQARDYSYVSRVINETIIIKVKNSAWMLELKKNQNELMKKLKDRTGKNIKQIKFVR